MANRLRATATGLLGAAQARLAATPTLVATASLLGQPAALLRGQVSLSATASLFGQPQAQLEVLIPELRATAWGMLGIPEATLANVLPGSGADSAILGDAWGLAWPWYAAGQDQPAIGAVSALGAPILSGNGIMPAIGMGSAAGQGASLGDAWVDWFTRYFEDSSS